MRCLDLSGPWSLFARQGAPGSLRDRRFDALVPGCVHTDLLRAGIIPDPHIGDAELEARWIAETDWDYSLRFTPPEAMRRKDRVELVFDRVDTFASVELDGHVLGQTANMFHPHRFDVRALLRDENELVLRFRSAVREVRAEEARLGPLPFLNTEHPFNFARKSAYHFGWDWAPSLIGCGLGAVRLEAWDGPRIVAVRPFVRSLTTSSADLEIVADIEGDARVRVEVERRGSRVLESAGDGGVHVEVREPEVWWPRGYGAQPLYDLTVTAGEHTVRTRTGLRTARLDTAGGAFTLVVNERAIQSKGANFIPDDSFFERATDPSRYRARLAAACDAGMNTLRIWGGGFYETETFYDLCDELGLLVWQDFLFACACYPEEEPHWSRVATEARHQVARLARHPSLVLWNGCNENLWGYVDWGWQEPTRGRTWGRGYYFDLLPKICAELDPSRPYWPGSPHSGVFDPPLGPHPNASESGNRHMWDVWKDGEHPALGKEAPRFVSEFGFQGPPSFALLERAMNGPGSPLLQHQKSDRTEEQARALLEAWFGDPGDVDREHHLRQVVQARAVSAAIEWFRVLWPHNAGALFWQLNDSWPAISWSAIDHDGRKKPLWYAARRAFAERAIFFQPAEPGSERTAVYVVNDTDHAFERDVEIERRGFDGALLGSVVVPARVAPRSVLRAALVEGALLPGDPSRELLCARSRTLVRHHFFDFDRRLALPPPRAVGHIVGDRLRIEALSLVRDAVLHVDRLDPEAELSDQLLTLLPGENITLELRASRTLEPAALLGHPVFQSSAAG